MQKVLNMGRRRKRSVALAPKLSWATFSKDGLPSSLIDPVEEQEDSVDNSQKRDGEARDHSYSFLAKATNWDALLDTAGVPTDGTPPDPLESERLARQMGVLPLDEMEDAEGCGSGLGLAPGQPGVTQPIQNLPPVPPEVQQKARERQKMGRGIEGADDAEVALDPMSQISKFDWDSMPLSGAVTLASCRCDAINSGTAEPGSCAMFGGACHPRQPAGPCMANADGACRLLHQRTFGG